MSGALIVRSKKEKINNQMRMEKRQKSWNKGSFNWTKAPKRDNSSGYAPIVTVLLDFLAACSDSADADNAVANNKIVTLMNRLDFDVQIYINYYSNCNEHNIQKLITIAFR